MKFKDKLCQSKRGLAQITDIIRLRFVSDHIYINNICNIVLTSYKIYTDCYKIMSMVKLIHECSNKFLQQKSYSDFSSVFIVMM